jgi:hypothetical protein
MLLRVCVVRTRKRQLGGFIIFLKKHAVAALCSSNPQKTVGRVLDKVKKDMLSRLCVVRTRKIQLGGFTILERF